MANPDKNHDKHALTLEDWLTISTIVIGCSKAVYSSYQYIEDTDNRLKRLAKTSKKDMAFLTSFSNVIKMKENQKFRPSYLRRKFPENLQNIQSADITDTLTMLRNYSMIAKTHKKDIYRRRGAPSRGSQDFLDEPGVKSYYQPIKNLESLKKIIDKPEARKIIYCLLMESNLIYRYWKIKALSYLYVLKFGGKDKRIEIDKATGQPTDEAGLEKLYTKIRSLDNRELEVLAEEKAKSITQNIREDDHDLLKFYLWGGSYFYA
jgi:hypothetical protein